MSITLKSDAFQESSPIPERYTSEGENLSPPLAWSDFPPETREFVLICDDPDAPQDRPFVHWLMYGIPPSVTSLPEGVPIDDRLTDPITALQGRNSWDETGYSGPLPPVGHGIHHYVFKIYALSSELMLEPEMDKQTVWNAMERYILDAGQLVGKYRRSSAPKASEPLKSTA